MKKTVLVTGSSRGIGRAVALKFASCGYRVVINCARSAERMEEVKKERDRQHDDKRRTGTGNH